MDEELNGQDGGKRQRNLLTSEMQLEIEETFAMVKGADDVMDYRVLPIALKALGMALTDLTDSDKFTDELEKYKVENIDLHKFVEIVAACTKQPNWAIKEMEEAFGYFDKDQGGTVLIGSL
jgi:Ca2+-binding EF-hand superfamily protein